MTDSEALRVEAQSDEVTLGEIMEVLWEMFGDQIPDATDILVPKWASNPLFRGTYSNWPIGVDLSHFLLMQVGLFLPAKLKIT